MSSPLLAKTNIVQTKIKIQLLNSIYIISYHPVLRSPFSESHTFSLQLLQFLPQLIKQSPLISSHGHLLLSSNCIFVLLLTVQYHMVQPLKKIINILSRNFTSCIYPKINVNPLTPMSDQDRISPYNVNTISSRQEMRIKKASVKGL